MVETKVCCGCGTEKPADSAHYYFRKLSSGSRIPTSHCKECKAVYCKNRYDKNRDQILARSKELRDAETPEQKARRAKRGAAFYAWEKVERPENLRERRRRANFKTRSSLEGRLRARVTTAIHNALTKGVAGRKTAKTFQLVGWDIEQLRAHLEERFEDGMSWDNMSEWEIDHVFPAKLYHIESDTCEEFRSLWRLKNLAPLWRVDNRSKQASFPWKLPDHYKNPKLRASYYVPALVGEMIEILDEQDAQTQDSGVIGVTGSTLVVESADSLSNGAFHKLQNTVVVTTN